MARIETMTKGIHNKMGIQNTQTENAGQVKRMQACRESVKASKIATWFLFAAAICAGLCAQEATTSIQDTIYHADGTVATGTILVTWPAFTAVSGQTVAAGNLTVPIGSNGSVSIQLTPNSGATPVGTYYTAVYHLDDGTVSKEYWLVPNTTQTTIYGNSKRSDACEHRCADGESDIRQQLDRELFAAAGWNDEGRFESQHGPSKCIAGSNEGICRCARISLSCWRTGCDAAEWNDTGDQ